MLITRWPHKIIEIGKNKFNSIKINALDSTINYLNNKFISFFWIKIFESLNIIQLKNFDLIFGMFKLHVKFITVCRRNDQIVDFFEENTKFEMNLN